MLEGFGVGLLVPFLDGLMNPDAEALKTGWEWFDTWVLAIGVPPLERLYRISALLLTCVWLRAGVMYMSAAANFRMVESAKHWLRCLIVDQVQAVSLRYFSRTRTGELINLMVGEIERIGNSLMVMRFLIVTAFMLSVYATASLIISWQLSLIAFGLALLLLGGFGRFLKKLRENGKAWSRTNARLLSAATELFGGIRTISEFGTQAYEAKRLQRVSGDAASTITNANLSSGLVGPISQGIGSTALVVLIVIAVQVLVSKGALTIAALLAFLVVLIRVLPFLQGINTARAEYAVYSGALGTVSDMLRTDDKPYLIDGTRSLAEFQDSIVLKNVGFEYEAGQPVLCDVSLTIEQGETVAIVGGSGAGKSTLVDLVMRLYDPQWGEVYLDGYDIRDYCLHDLRRRISVVNQHTFLFNESIRANIAYGLEDVSDEQVRSAAAEANALEFIEAMPERFDTMLGERGARLSGGQRQRIAIARALLRDPDILILDEATSALDSMSERLVQESLERLMQGRTVIVIAHRLSTIENADRVVVVEEGRIVEEGTYEDLLLQEGRLWAYHTMQFQAA